MKGSGNTSLARDIRGRASSRARRTQLVAAGLLLLALTLCLIGDVAQARAAAPTGKGSGLGRPTARSPKGTTTPLRPTLSWTKVRGASSYDLQILQGNKLKRFFNGHRGTSRHLLNALPANVGLTWRVRARTRRFERGLEQRHEVHHLSPRADVPHRHHRERHARRCSGAS